MNDLPFFANTNDDTHCVQAAFKIMLKHVLPEHDFSFEKLDQMSCKVPGKGTWWPPLLLEIQKMGVQVVNIENFDYKRFYREGEPYVRSIFPDQTADFYLNKTNLMDIKPLIPEFLDKVKLQTRAGTLKDITNLLNDGWLVGVEINSNTFNSQPGFVGHMVVIYKMDKNNIWFHDPGLPPKPNRKIGLDKFLEAWFSSGEDNASIVALKRT